MKNGCPCKSAQHTNPNCSYCGKGKQSDGESGGKPFRPKEKKPPGRGKDSNGGDPNDNSLSLLKAALVFATGCYLTMQMTNVANELG